MTDTLKVGVFDSGIGGMSIAKAIKEYMPQLEVVFRDDSAHLPYGDKPMDEVYGYVEPILRGMVEEGCKIIVIACNTVTTNLISRLREQISVPLVGVEPMVKPAAQQSKSGVIAVCATPGTLNSPRYKQLKELYAAGVQVIEPDCSNWTRMIESKTIDHDFIRKQIVDACNNGADVIVLGCTHYHWIEEEIKHAAQGRAVVLQPEQPVLRQLNQVIEQLR